MLINMAASPASRDLRFAIGGIYPAVLCGAVAMATGGEAWLGEVLSRSVAR